MRKIKFWDFFLFMGFMGLLLGGFALLAQSKSPNLELRSLSPIVAFLMGYAPCQLGSIVFWLAARMAGHKDGLPIK